MRSKIIFNDRSGAFEAEVELLEEASALKSASDEMALAIMREASNGPVYSREIASRLKVREQTVYYHVRKLVSLGLLRVHSTQLVRGALAKRVEASSQGLAFIYDRGSLKPLSRRPDSDSFRRFFKEFVQDGSFRGYIVVGSPEPHGRFRASARDGHYATQLALYIGSIALPSSSFAVKLDTDTKVEMSYTDNMVLIGGPATNQIMADVNNTLPVRFDETNYWAGLLDEKGRRFSSDTDALIAKVRNPFNPQKHIVAIAGIRHVGTKAAVIALTQQPDEVLGEYRGEEPFACVIRGFDQDGDGKVDRADLVASYNPAG
ncbi:MAG: helix-turn-helix domain-containing protein [Conexivisphaerales archaeon]